MQVSYLWFEKIDFFHKRHDSNPPQTNRQVPEPKITDRGLFSKRRSQEDLKEINPGLFILII